MASRRHWHAWQPQACMYVLHALHLHAMHGMPGPARPERIEAPSCIPTPEGRRKESHMCGARPIDARMLYRTLLVHARTL